MAARRLAALHLPGQVWTDPDQVLRFICATHRRQLTVAHAPDRLAAQLFAALPPVALLGRWSC